MNSAARPIDCVVFGETGVDLMVQPVPQNKTLAELRPHVDVDSIRAGTGGNVPNAGIALARLGLSVAAATLIGKDEWGDLVLRRLTAEGLDTSHVRRLPDIGTNVTAVMTDGAGTHTFIHQSGAARRIDRDFALGCMDLFGRSRFALFGYYNLMPHLQDDLPEILAAVREAGCRTALDCANGGGTMQPLDAILPHLDIYIPNITEARNQTGETEPEAILDAYRSCGTSAVLGVTSGEEGALLSPAPGLVIDVPAIPPPGPIVDTTGAGDCFLAGLVAGLLNGLSLPEAAALASATAAYSITGLGGSEAVAGYSATLELGRSRGEMKGGANERRHRER